MITARTERLSAAAIALALVLAIGAFSYGCAGQPHSDQSNDASSGETQVGWTGEEDCGLCHSDRADMASGGAMAAVHATNDCLTCHNDSTSLATAHEGATADSKMPKKLKDTDIESDTCLSCHGSWQKLAEKTSGLTVLTDEEGTTVNPHELPAAHVDEKLNCIDCHTVHEESDIAQKSEDSCISCHHKNVYACGTCH